MYYNVMYKTYKNCIVLKYEKFLRTQINKNKHQSRTY